MRVLGRRPTGSSFDALARAAATGEVSRRSVLVRAGALLAGASLSQAPAVGVLSDAEAAFRRRKRCHPGHLRCGRTCCPVGEVCKHGKCRCVKPHKQCGKTCADLRSDPLNCGACKHRCPHGQVCAHGKCQAHCSSLQTNCSNTCVSLSSDPLNCGACGKTCATGQVCASGVCTTTCPSGMTACAGGCVALASNPSHCGSCGNACPANDTCVNGTCTPPPATCSDGVKNDSETDVDCGGPHCAKCAEGKGCNGGNDCLSGVCTAGVCVAPAPTCSDGIQNEGETDVDCGGPNCPKCAEGKGCAGANDCLSGVCTAGVCAAPAPTCSDGIQNEGETDIDCGGPNCPKCADGKGCAGASDCVSGVCAAGACAVPTCSDGVQNGSETDVDCGGPNCPGCANGQGCVHGTDCLSGVCTAGVCAAPAPTCSDGIQNEGETDIDCGGPNCPKCANGKMCDGASDCVSGVCTAGVCVAPATCSDGIQNEGETDIDCGGPNCPPCANGQHCGSGGDCTSGHCSSGTCVQCAVAADCTTPMNATATCTAGTCGFTCDADFADCDRIASNGCEVNTSTNVMNCGSCGTVCPSGPNSTTTCSSGHCGLTCFPGFGDCDGNPANGCEANLNTDSHNCGSCGATCGGTTMCIAGICS